MALTAPPELAPGPALFPVKVLKMPSMLVCELRAMAPPEPPIAVLFVKLLCEFQGVQGLQGL